MVRRVLVIVPDLFFATRIREVAATIDVAIIEASPADAADAARTHGPDLAIVDLHGSDGAADSVRSIRDAMPGTHIVAFHSHVDIAAREAALAAGADQVLPRSAFTRRLAEVLSEA